MKILLQLYSSLSQLTKRSFLMHTELPTVLNVFKIDCEFRLWYLQTDIVKAKKSLPFHQETIIEGYQYCTTLDWAFLILISENFNSFVLAIGCTAVAIHCKGNVGLKIFHFHVRDIMENAILKVHVCCLKGYNHWITWYIIFT